MNATARSEIDRAPGHLRGLLRHFTDLRDGTYGEGAVSRVDKEKIFIAAIDYLVPYAWQALDEMNSVLMLASGTVAASGVTKSPEGGLTAVWTLSWPEQEQAGIPPRYPGGILRAQFPPSPPARRYRGSLAAQRLQR